MLINAIDQEVLVTSAHAVRVLPAPCSLCAAPHGRRWRSAAAHLHTEITWSKVSAHMNQGVHFRDVPSTLAEITNLSLY